VKTAFTLLILFWLSPVYGIAAYFERFEVITNSGKRVDAYMVKPAVLVAGDGEDCFSRFRFAWEMRPNQERAREILAAAAEFIDDFSISMGHVNENTRGFHQAELLQLRSGRWPTVVVTEPGRLREVLFTAAIALPLGQEPLPFQSRFAGSRVFEGQNFQENEVGQFHDPERKPSGFSFPLVSQGSESLNFTYHHDLSPILSRLPWWKGRAAELKFLVQKKGTPENLPAVGHALISAFGLHRFSTQKISPRIIREQVRRMKLPETKEPLWQALRKVEQQRLAWWGHSEDPTAPEKQKRTRALFAGLRKTLWSPRGFQRFAAVSSLYSQVSEREAVTGGSLTSLFLRRFRFPSVPLLDFMESASFGTEGIRTRIFQQSFEDFDIAMALGLNSEVLELGRALTWSRPTQPQFSCPHLVDEFVGRTLRESRLEFSRSQ